MSKKHSETTHLAAENIKKFRQLRELSQDALAKKLDTSQSTIIAWEKPSRSPTANSLHNLAAVLRTEPWVFLLNQDDEVIRLLDLFFSLEAEGRRVVLSVAEGQALSQSDD